ncbi:hypothetical protein, partial [Listeria monocytogenes]|uniref:hypothetical protein n=1 Tax=Listeria monocytogenes TaxID=1639 RepID=UPI001A7EA5DA
KKKTEYENRLRSVGSEMGRREWHRRYEALCFQGSNEECDELGAGGLGDVYKETETIYKIVI